GDRLPLPVVLHAQRPCAELERTADWRDRADSHRIVDSLGDSARSPPRPHHESTNGGCRGGVEAGACACDSGSAAGSRQTVAPEAQKEEVAEVSWQGTAP